MNAGIARDLERLRRAYRVRVLRTVLGRSLYAGYVAYAFCFAILNSAAGNDLRLIKPEAVIVLGCMLVAAMATLSMFLYLQRQRQVLEPAGALFMRESELVQRVMTADLPESVLLSICVKQRPYPTLGAGPDIPGRLSLYHWLNLASRHPWKIEAYPELPFDLRDLLLITAGAALLEFILRSIMAGWPQAPFLFLFVIVLIPWTLDQDDLRQLVWRESLIQEIQRRMAN